MSDWDEGGSWGDSDSWADETDSWDDDEATNAPATDFLDSVEYTGDVAADSAAEFVALDAAVEAHHTAIRSREQSEKAKRALVLDSRHYVCLTFTTPEAREAFLRAVGWTEPGDIHVDGHKLAALVGVDVPYDALPSPQWKPNKKLADLAMK
jgi:hypothetical protein